ncbi:MAG: FtsQ-type POTRA domain-containing protein [Patescibacteria group bacterium]|nr:FtsQ-type POTRA domain-containing protein [Patescibacteria group bacterium]
MSLFGNYPARRHLPIDYHEKKLENPFYRRRERIMSFAGVKGKLIIGFIVLVLIFIIWFVFISHFWGIKKISISGVDQMSDADVRGLISEQMRANHFLLFPQSNLLFFSKNKFEATLQKKYHFQKIDVEKEWPDSLSIDIVNKPLACIWREGDKYYYADTDGYAVQEISPLDLKDNKYPLIVNQSTQRMYGNRIAVDPSYLNFTASLYDKFAKQMPGISIDHFIVDDDLDTIKLLTPEGLKIIFNTKDDVGKQLNNLLILKDQKLKDDFAKQKMIDLRFGDKIYYQ